MLLRASLILCLMTITLCTNAESTLPITTCKHDSINYSTCLKRFLKESWPQFIAGLPDINFPSLDPLFYENGTAVFDSGLIHANVTLSDATAMGLSKTRFHDIKTHFLNDVFRLQLDTYIPKIFIKGKVKVNGTLGVFKIAEEGHFNSTIEDIESIWDLTGHVINDTWTVEHFNALPSIKNLKVNFDDLFQDNKELSNLVTLFVNEFWPPLYRVMLPVASNIWDSWICNITNNIFSKYNFSQLFP